MTGSRFRFSLDPVLDGHARSVESAQRALADAIRATAQAQRTVEAAAAAVDASSQAGEGGGPAWRLQASARHRDAARTDHSRALQALARVQDAEARARRQLAAAVRKHEALSAVREEAEAAHRASAMRAELTVLDDLAASRHTSLSVGR